MSNLQELTDSNFTEEVFCANQPVLVDFWAPWCGPCKMLTPTIEEISKDYKDKIKVVKIDIQKHQNIAKIMGIRSIPTVALFDGEQAVNAIIGMRPKKDFEKMIDGYLKKKTKKEKKLKKSAAA
jgi:thioredoxin 1